MKNHYKTLGVSINATDAEIKKAYKQLALMYHPDINNSQNAAGKFIEINEAYETLIDKVKRLNYDIALNEYLSGTKPPPIIPKAYPRKPKPVIRDDNIPYNDGVPGTNPESIAENRNDKNSSFSIWRFIAWILLSAFISYAIRNR